MMVAIGLGVTFADVLLVTKKGGRDSLLSWLSHSYFGKNALGDRQGWGNSSTPERFPVPCFCCCLGVVRSRGIQDLLPTRGSQGAADHAIQTLKVRDALQLG